MSLRAALLLLFLCAALGIGEHWALFDLDHGTVGGRTGVASQAPQRADQSPNCTAAFRQWPLGASVHSGFEGHCTAEESSLEECLGWSSGATVGRNQNGAQEEPRPTGTLLQLLRSLWQEERLLLLRLRLAVPSRAICGGTASTSVASSVNMECSRTVREPDSPTKAFAEVTAQGGRSRSARACRRRWWERQAGRQAEWPKATRPSDASLGPSAAEIGAAVFFDFGIGLLGGSVTVGPAVGYTPLVQRSPSCRSCQHAWRPRALAESDAEQSSAPGGGHADEGSDRASSGSRSEESLHYSMVGLHGEASSCPLGPADRAKQSLGRLHRTRRKVEAAIERVYSGSFKALGGCSEGQLRRGRGPRHEDREGRGQGPLGGGRNYSSAQGESGRTTLCPGQGKGKGGVGGSRPAGPRTHSQALSAGDRRHRSPSQGLGLSLMILSGPSGTNGVQEWTHSVTRSADFVFPPLAQFFGLQAEFEEILSQQGFQMTTKWYDPRIDVDLHHLARGATQDWGACVDGSPSRASPGLGAGDYMDNSVSIEPSWVFARGVDGAVLQTCQSSDCHLNCSATSCTVCRAFVHRQHCSVVGHAPPSGKFWHDLSEVPLQVASYPAYEAAVATSRAGRCLRSCLKAGVGVGGERVCKRVSFGFGVSFWFPSRTQLQRTCHLHPPDGLAAPHDVSSTFSFPHLPFWDFGHVHMQAIPAPVVEPAASDALKGPISFLSFASLPASEGCIPDAGSQELSSPAVAGGNLCLCNTSVGRIPADSFTHHPCGPRAVRSPLSSVGAFDVGVALPSASWGRRLSSCSSSVGLVSELSTLDGFLPCSASSDWDLVSHDPPLLSDCDIPVWECARKKPQSKQAAFRLGAAPYCPPPVRNPGLHKPLSDAGHFQVAEPQVLSPAEEVLNPYSSFDAVNGARSLAAEADWPTDRYITYAIDTARLPGNPLARFLRFELVDHPGPQVALTQDHGIARLRAVVFDFRPFQGQVEVIDTPPSVSTLEQVRLSRTINDVTAAVDVITGHACTTIVNGVIAPPLAALPMDADLVLFQLWQDGAPLNTWRPYQFGDARPPVPPIPDSDDMPSVSQGFRVFTGASSTRPAAIPRHSPVSVAPEDERYTFMDIRIGVSNRPKPPPGTQQACLADAMLAVPRGAQPPLGARIIERALPGLQEPQVTVTRVTHDRGWHTIALDLRQVNLGIKVLHVRLGSSIRQLFSYDSPLQHELVQLGRGEIVFSYMMNLESCLLDTAFHVRTDTLTLTPLAGQHPGHSAASSSAPSRWARRLQPQPLEVVTSLIEGSEGLFTVYDTVHHFRILRCEHSDTPEILIARALSLTPELPGAEGILLLHGIAELPFPQIILVPAGSGDLIVPLLYKINPVSVCTLAVPPDASTFMVAYHASNSCRALTGAQHQIARRTAAIVGHHGSVDPFRSGCATEHGVLVLRGYSFASAALRRRLRSAGQPSPDFVEARSWEPHDDLSVEDTHRIRVFRARGLPGSVSIAPTATLRSIREYISLYCPSGPPAALRWPTVCPGVPGAVPVVVALSEEALDEARHWALVDIRRVGHPPLLPFQTVPLPAMVDLRTVLSLTRHELPTLRPISGAYFNDYALTEDPRMAGDIMLLTLMRWEPDRDNDAGAVVPALDINLDLLERRVALHAFFNRYAPRVQGHGLALSSTSPSITEDSTDASASFHSGSLPEDLDADEGLALEAIGTPSTTTTSCPSLDSTSTTTGTPAMRTGASSSRSPGPRACNLVSSIEDVWAAGIRVYAVCGNCRPRHLEVVSPVCLAAVLTHFTEAFADMGLLPDAAHWLLSPRAHWLWNGELGVFLTTGWGSLEPRSVAIWIEPGHRWQEPFVTSVPNHASREQIFTFLELRGPFFP